jgi:hypothetical protein
MVVVTPNPGAAPGYPGALGLDIHCKNRTDQRASTIGGQSHEVLDTFSFAHHFGLHISDGLRSNAVAGGPVTLASLAGTYTETGHGQDAFCHNSQGPIPCSSFHSGDILETFQFLDLAEGTADTNGNFCGTHTAALADLPVDNNVTFVFHTISVSTVTNYDPSTGIGDLANTAYIGGHCNGASFDSGGATQTGTGTVHFIVSSDGKRIDFMTTASQDASGDAGGFQESETALKR